MAEPQPPYDREMHRFRERMAAAIALLVIGGSVALIAAAFLYVESESFEKVKDLLLFVNPLLGVVIGYYFNKVSSEARAETAEQAAGRALATADEARDDRRAAQAKAQENWDQMQRVRAAMADLAAAAEKMMEHPQPPSPGVLGAPADGGRSAMDAGREMQAALANARRVWESTAVGEGNGRS
jgi:hypothetical protein